MAKHMIEEDYLGVNGFHIIQVGDNKIVCDNVEKRTLVIKSDGSLDLDVIKNELLITNKKPVFTTVDW